MFLKNFTYKEFILNQRCSTFLSHYNKLFIAYLSSSAEHDFSSVDKREFVRFKFPKCVELKDLVVTKQKVFDSSFSIIPGIISVDQESQLIDEIEKSLKRLRYQHDHWDDVNKKLKDICFEFEV